MHERVIVAHVPQRQNQVALDAGRSRRRRRDLTLRDALRPVGVDLQRACLSLVVQHAVHRRAAHAGSQPPLPGFRVRLQLGLRLENVIDASRELVAKLMTEVAVGLERVDPVILRLHVGAEAVALRSRSGELARRRRLEHRQPVVAGIHLRGFLRRLRRIHFQRDRGRARLHLLALGIGDAVSTDEHAVAGARQLGQHEAALIVGDDDLDEVGGQVLRLSDHPHAGFRTLRALDDASDEAGRRGRRLAVYRDRDDGGCQQRNRTTEERTSNLHSPSPVVMKPDGRATPSRTSIEPGLSS